MIPTAPLCELVVMFTSSYEKQHNVTGTVLVPNNLVDIYLTRGNLKVESPIAY